MSGDPHENGGQRDRERSVEANAERSGGDRAGHDHTRPRYLTAKRSVDDRARDRRVAERLRRALPDDPHVVEAGCGAGLAVPTLYEWGLTPASYRGIDTDPGIVTFARHLVSRVLRRYGYEAIDTAEGCRIDGTDVTFETGDALQHTPESAPDGSMSDGSTSDGSDAGEGADLLLAQSFLDLVPLEAALDAVERALSPAGLAYAPITFDGETVFLPEHPADERVVEAFHREIDSTAGRDSRAGRHLIERLGEHDADLLAVGASDWVVRPVDGEYPEDERYFLACILGFVADAVADVRGGEAWIETRRRQLDAGELTYVAHGYDVLWRPATTA